MLTSAEGVLVLLARPLQLLSAQRRESVVGLLSPEDRAHAARFRAERDRDLAVASRATQRLALSLATNQAVPPGEWRFVSGDNGRPLLSAPPAPWSGLRFSVANTVGLVGCAVTTNREVGLDVEQRSKALPIELLESCLSREELADLFALAEDARPDRFVHLWTAKEAYLKACSLGITDSLQQVEISFDRLGRPELRASVPPQRHPRQWQMKFLAPTLEHIAAVCVERLGNESDVAINLRWALSLDESVPDARAE